MSEKFTFNGGNSKSTRESFQDRRSYKQSARLKGVQMIDTWYQYPNYGLLNSDYKPCVVEEGSEKENLKKFDSLLGVGQRSLPFVVDAFQDFRRYYVSKTNTANLDFPLFINEAVPVFTYVSFETVYVDYLTKVVNDYMFLTLRKMTSYEQFHEKLTEIIEKNIQRFPITKSGFLLSDKCPINVSGLCIELAPLDYSLDNLKGDMLSEKEFQCFAEVANTYGFYIDKNAPWRLIANLESEAMQSYITRYRPGTDYNIILNKTFRSKTEYEDVASVNYFYYLVYNKMLEFVGDERPWNWPQSEIISHTLMIRMLETGIDMSLYKVYNDNIQNLLQVYSSSFQGQPLRPISAKIGDICSERLREIYSSREKLNSYNKTTLKDYM